MPRRRRRPRVLWVTEEPPDRSLGGGNIRQAHLLEALASAVPTDLLVAAPVRDEGVRKAAANVFELPARSMPQGAHPAARRALELGVILGSRYPSALYSAGANRRALARAVRASAYRYDAVCVEHEALAPLLPRSRAGSWIISFHNVLSGMIAEDLRLAPGARQRWFRARDFAKAQRLERWALGAYDCCIACSDQDASRLSSLGRGESNRIAVVPNGVDLAALRATPIPDAPRVLLPATFAWPPNVDGAVWLCTKVWPRVRAAVPDATLVLAGRSPVADVIELGRLPGVSIEADVASMVPYFELTRVVVVPLRIGTGTRLKALEAMAAGRPVVGTQIGLEGVGIQDRVQARVADDAEGFADAVIELLQRDTDANALGRAARAHVEQAFGWDRIGGEFVQLVSALLERGAPLQDELRASSKLA